MSKKKTKSVKERLISKAQTRIKNQHKKLSKAKAEYEKIRNEVNKEIAEQREILKALGVK